jgi:hypothetical protein
MEPSCSLIDGILSLLKDHAALRLFRLFETLLRKRYWEAVESKVTEA